MSTRLLGPTIDIHGGGGDLAFPHHECEIAQVEPLTGRAPFVRLWMHTAMVEHAGAKMSKSLGNLVMVRDLLERWSPDAVRLYLARHHYREPWAHDPGDLTRADALAAKLRDAVTAPGGRGDSPDTAAAEAGFTAAMNDDLDTRTALVRLERLADETLSAARAGRHVEPAQKLLRRLAQVFGLRLDASAAEPRVLDGWNAHLARFTGPGAT
jgi:L-cysteine:1D-myo-inositol 2-amino-2-deoxy-alpha-D-glucopyranoside ligase